ncbi:TetR/AcrR family transcriptional regulator [Pseudomonas sp. MAFF 301449]|uniref:TetR/AcrR family transcriptional regulator n=1 Tax=Pseudomonas cyclaminis TaxID=2781239 RepID=A0ABR9SSM3_9PSED|nr:TetR/AcrR family transcriptional regulator [Pseudomonas cyclaminis]MBE8591935.1 TetR/AcrR family transcriptional regulator [Pseudomonas cyclaminis]MBE8600133.1 TetR/AcrR family transcriptional regulator [Pseudomonas cyclaminis]
MVVNQNSKPQKNQSEGRQARKQQQTRAGLLEAGYYVMSENGIDAAKIKDITSRADVGFGTFYNYFENKDELASQILDCIINDFGNRSVLATRELAAIDPSLAMPVSIRLIMRAVITDPLWQWWALRPELLANRMRAGFEPFGMQDIHKAIALGLFTLDERDIPSAWALATWMMVAGIHDIVIGQRPPESETFIVDSVMRVFGVAPEVARRISSSQLPEYPPSDIDWGFRLSVDYV